MAKVGHTGTLDPLATGMLPVCINEATKFSQFLLDADKAYAVTAKLGQTTTTGDADGESLLEVEVPDLDDATLIELLKRYRGEQIQTAPKYSALKYQGKPLYYWARKGIEVPLKSRPVTIRKLEFRRYDPASKELSFVMECSKGTYVRSLVESLGEDLAVGAHVVSLRRLFVNPFSPTMMLPLEEQKLDNMIPIEDALSHIPLMTLSDREAGNFINGIKLAKEGVEEGVDYRIFGPKGLFLGIGEVLSAQLKVKRLRDTERLKALLVA